MKPHELALRMAFGPYQEAIPVSRGDAVLCPCRGCTPPAPGEADEVPFVSLRVGMSLPTDKIMLKAGRCEACRRVYYCKEEL